MEGVRSMRVAAGRRVRPQDDLALPCRAAMPPRSGSAMPTFSLPTRAFVAEVGAWTIHPHGFIHWLARA
jgi:hypothetical protein